MASKNNKNDTNINKNKGEEKNIIRKKIPIPQMMSSPISDSGNSGNFFEKKSSPC